MKKGAIEILKKHGCLYMKDDYSALFRGLEAYYLTQKKDKKITYEPMLGIVCPECGCNKMQNDWRNNYTCLNTLCDWSGLIVS